MNKIKSIFEYLYSKFFSLQLLIFRFIVSTLFNFRLIGLLTLIFITLVSLFNFKGAKLTNEILILCCLIFLSSCLSELKNWNIFNGLIKGETKDLTNIPESGGINPDQLKPNEQEVAKAENEPIQLMAYDKGNFLALAFEIERLLRVLATVTLSKDIPSNINPKRLVNELHSVGMITDIGKQQIYAIRWLKKLLVDGREAEINQETLNSGITLAFNLYKEIYNWINKKNKS